MTLHLKPGRLCDDECVHKELHTGRFLTPFCAQSALPTILRRHGPASCKVETVICPLKSSSSKCVMSRQFVHCSRSSWCLTCVGVAGCVWRKSHRTGWAGFQCFYNSKRVSESKLQYRKRRAPYTALVTTWKPVWWAKKTNCSTDMDISSSFHESFLILRVSHVCHMQQPTGVSLVVVWTNYMMLLRKGPLLDKTFEFVFMLAFKNPSNKVPNWTHDPLIFILFLYLNFFVSLLVITHNIWTW